MHCRACKFNLNGRGPHSLRAVQNEQGMWTVCSQECRIHFMRRWVQLHVQECARLGGFTTLPTTLPELGYGQHGMVMWACGHLGIVAGCNATI